MNASGKVSTSASAAKETSAKMDAVKPISVLAVNRNSVKDVAKEYSLTAAGNPSAWCA